MLKPFWRMSFDHPITIAPPRIAELREARAVQPPWPPPGLDPQSSDTFATFQVALDTALKDVVAGYVAQLRQSGQILFTNAWQRAKRPQDGSELWTPDVQMHVASVRKLMTAMAMMVLLGDKNISPDAQIIDYLPDYWVKGPNINTSSSGTCSTTPVASPRIILSTLTS